MPRFVLADYPIEAGYGCRGDYGIVDSNESLNSAKVNTKYDRVVKLGKVYQNYMVDGNQRTKIGCSS